MTKSDNFAQIANSAPATIPAGLQEGTPPRLPRHFLPAYDHDPQAVFQPSVKLETHEQLQRELREQRTRHAKFFRNFSPPLQTRRVRSTLNQFKWRMASAEDLADFSRVLDGAGSWENVTIPHYGGPIGRATAYYRTTFTATNEMLELGAFFVRFGAVDYFADVFVNGHAVGHHEGFFAPFACECHEVVRSGENVLVVRVRNDAVFMGNSSWGAYEEGDKLYAATGLGWNDPKMGWHHCPPGFGICQPVVIEACADLHIADLWVRPLSTNDGAVEISIEVWSRAREARDVGFEVSILGRNFRRTVLQKKRFDPRTRVVPGVGDLRKPTDHQEVALRAASGLNRYRFPYRIQGPRIWSPDTPWLYQAQVTILDSEGVRLDSAQCQFGVRTFIMDTTSVPRGRLLLNGKPLRLRGANTMGFEQQDVFRGDFRQLVDDMLLAKICHMNFWRLTQRPVQPEVYEYADRLGLLLQTDLPLFGCVRYNKFAEVVRQAEEMERLVRSHPSNILISYINEPFPEGNGKPHRHLQRAELQALFRATDEAVHAINPDRVIKHVDGDYDPPSATLPDNHCYSAWYNGHGVELGRLHRGYWLPVRPDWCYACGEFGAEGLDPVDLMRRHYPKEWLPRTDTGADAKAWSPNSIKYAQTGKFQPLWFETPDSVPAWVQASQEFQAWATRLFTERFRRDNRMVSFAIHLFIDAFPSGWMKSIMDCERRPKLAYFAFRDSLTPLMANIRTDRWAFFAGETLSFEIWICNDTAQTGNGFRLRWQIEQEGRVLFAQQSAAKIESTSSTFQGHFCPKAPEVIRRTKFTLRLALFSGQRRVHETTVVYEVFPARIKKWKNNLQAQGRGLAQILFKELGGQFAAGSPRVLLFGDYDTYRRQKRRTDAAVRAGATVVFLELPPGDYHFGELPLKIIESPDRPRQFVARASAHPMVTDFLPGDFSRWFDAKRGYFSPLVHNLVIGDGWTPILITGEHTAGDISHATWAAGEHTDGLGRWRVCQVRLAGMVKYNPVAASFARRMLTPPPASP